MVDERHRRARTPRGAHLNDPDAERSIAAMEIMFKSGNPTLTRMALEIRASVHNPTVRRIAVESTTCVESPC